MQQQPQHKAEGGGATRTTKATSAAAWKSTGRHVAIKDGSKRTLYTNPKFPGELRIRKMRQGKDGRMTAAYVKLPGGTVVGGGWFDEWISTDIKCNPLVLKDCSKKTGYEGAECNPDKFFNKDNTKGTCRIPEAERYPERFYSEADTIRR